MEALQCNPQPFIKAVPDTAVHEQLRRVLSSPGFVSSARLCRFLTHIVNRTLDRNPGVLKEFSIAMEVFDRTADYDPDVDAIVRVEARRLRAKLKAYYENSTDPVLIELRPGSYVPAFRWSPEATAEEPAQSQRPCPGTCIAVLPFVNMSSEPEQDHFCDGLSEEIIGSLAQVAGIKVIARTSAFQFKGVATDIRVVGLRLGADLVIEGSVRKAGEELRITAQAIDTDSGYHLWSETFHRRFQDVFAIQEEIASAVAEVLRVTLPGPGISRNRQGNGTSAPRARIIPISQ